MLEAKGGQWLVFQPSLVLSSKFIKYHQIYVDEKHLELFTMAHYPSSIWVKEVVEVFVEWTLAWVLGSLMQLNHPEGISIVNQSLCGRQLWLSGPFPNGNDKSHLHSVVGTRHMEQHYVPSPHDNLKSNTTTKWIPPCNYTTKWKSSIIYKRLPHTTTLQNANRPSYVFLYTYKNDQKHVVFEIFINILILKHSKTF